jgi:hypothetical protein
MDLVELQGRQGRQPMATSTKAGIATAMGIMLVIIAWIWLGLVLNPPRRYHVYASEPELLNDLLNRLRDFAALVLILAGFVAPGCFIGFLLERSSVRSTSPVLRGGLVCIAALIGGCIGIVVVAAAVYGMPLSVLMQMMAAWSRAMFGSNSDEIFID